MYYDMEISSTYLLTSYMHVIAVSNYNYNTRKEETRGT